MAIKDGLQKSGTIINTRETNFGEYRKEVEVWCRKDSDAFREFFDVLVCHFPDLEMDCNVRPHPVTHGRNMASVWRSPNWEPYIRIFLDMDDCPEYGRRWRMPLKSLLAEVQEQGVKHTMPFRVTMDCGTWQRFVVPNERAM